MNRTFRVSLGRGGLGGYWKVQERVGIFWITRNKYSIYVYGDDKAHRKASEAVKQLREDSNV